MSPQELESTAPQLFKLKNREFTYTVDDSELDCGLDGPLYFFCRGQGGRASKYSNAGAKLGFGYCDAQCPHDLKWMLSVLIGLLRSRMAPMFLIREACVTSRVHLRWE